MERGGTNYWFTPRRYGYGATPATWQGWTAIIAFVVVCGLVTLAQFAWMPGVWGVVFFVIFLPTAVFGFIALVRKKTDGEWRWRWGDESR